MTITKKQSGFTLIELIVVIVILGIISMVFSQLLLQGLRVATTEQSLIDALWQGQIALERMVRDIRETRSGSDINVASDVNNYEFVDMNGNTIDYTLSGTNLMRNTQILATGINTLTFQFYDQNGVVTATMPNVHYIKITLNVTQNQTNYTLTTGVYLRDLPP